MGPGSARGLARLLYGDDWEGPAGLYRRNQDEWLKDFGHYLLAKTADVMPPESVKRMEAMDWQNCLCEYDKYERILWGQGTPKQLYRGGQ